MATKKPSVQVPLAVAARAMGKALEEVVSARTAVAGRDDAVGRLVHGALMEIASATDGLELRLRVLYLATRGADDE